MDDTHTQHGAFTVLRFLTCYWFSGYGIQERGDPVLRILEMEGRGEYGFLLGVNDIDLKYRITSQMVST